MGFELIDAVRCIDGGRPTTRRSVWLSVVVVLAGAACSRPAPVVRKRHLIRIEGMSFGGIPDGIRVGDAIDWRNADTVDHSATATNGAFDLSLPAGQSVESIVDQAGEIDFYCRYHQRMTGKMVVLDAAGPAG